MEFLTISQESIMTRGVLAEYIQNLGAPFLQIHRSVIINLNYIRRMTNSTVVMINNIELPIGRTKIKIVKEKLARYLTMGYNDND
ncbi:LytTr DNA-binding domain protein [compost metagenome]